MQNHKISQEILHIFDLVQNNALDKRTFAKGSAGNQPCLGVGCPTVISMVYCIYIAMHFVTGRASCTPLPQGRRQGEGIFFSPYREYVPTAF